MNREPATPKDRAVDLLVFGPLGVAVLARDGVRHVAGTAVRRGRDEVGRRRDEIDARVGQYRTIGQLAWTFGAPEARRRVERIAREARTRAEDTLGGVSEAARRATVGFGPGESPTPPTSGDDETWWHAPAAPAAGDQYEPQRHPTEVVPEMFAPIADDVVGELRAVDLVIPGYDELSAEQVVDRLDGLSREEVDAVRAYEGTHRGRRTILAKLDHLSTA